jgi:hypothetical protein
MRQIVVILFFLFGLSWIFPSTAQAAKLSPIPSATPSAITTPSVLGATDSAVATPSAVVETKPVEKNDKDITLPTSPEKDKLIEILDKNPVAPLSWNNPLQHAIRRAIHNGFPVNIIVLILLFPLITSVISFSRHVIGLKGFGVYTPAVLSVAFVSTGIVNGIFLFIVVLTAAMLMRKILKKLNLQYLPRTAMLLWGVSILTLIVLIGLSFVPVTTLTPVNIFPLLIIMLLTENFMETQLSSSQSEATQLTIETVVTAIFCTLMISSDFVQRNVILQPELTLVLVAIFNIIVGKYAGLRLLEWIRFRSIIDQ